MVSLDGGNRVVGTEFIKLLITGSSNLATEEYVDTKVSEGIGGASADAYTKAETNALLNNKLNVANPDVSGNLRIQPTFPFNGKLIINTTSPTDNSYSFFCNGKGEFNSTLKASVINCTNDVNASGINADTFNSNVITSDIIFNHSDSEYMRYSNSQSSLNLNTTLDLKTSTLKTNTFDTSSTNTKISYTDNGFEYMKYENASVDVNFYGLKVLSNLYTKNVFPDGIKMVYNNKISFIDTNGATDGDYYDDNYINITIEDSIQRINQVIIGNGEHRFYNGSIDTASDGDLTLKMSNARIDFYKDLYLNNFSIADTLNCSSIVSTNDIETATVIKTNNFENYDDSNIVFSHDAVNYLAFNKDTGTLITPNDDAGVKVGVFFEGNRTIKAIEGFVGSIYNNDNVSQAPRFQHLGNEYMRYEDVVLNSSTQGIKMNASLYSQDIIPTQIKMTYNTKISFTDSDGATDGDYFNDNYIMMSIADTIPRLNFVVIDGSEMRFYVGSRDTVFDGDMVMKLSSDRITFYRQLYDNNTPLGSGGYTDGEIDTFLSGKLTIATPETLTGKLTIDSVGTQLALSDTTADREIAITTGDSIDCSEKATSSNPAELKINYNRDANVRIGNTASSLSINTAKFTDKVLSVLGDAQINGQLRLTSHLTLQPNLLIYFDSATANRRYIRARQLSGAPGFQPLDIVNENTNLGRITLTMGSNEIVRVSNTEVLSLRNHRFSSGIEISVLDSYHQNTDMVFRRDGNLYMTFSTTDQIIFNKLIQFFNNSINVNEIRNFSTDEDINFIHEATTYLTYDYTNNNLICKSGFLTVENSIGCNSFVNRIVGDVQFGYQGNAYLEYKNTNDEIWLNKPTRINSALNFSGGSSETVIYEATVLASNILYIKNTQAIQTPEIVFQVGSTEIIDMEENTTRIKNTLSVENSSIECLTYGSNVNISTAVKFQKQGVDYMEFDNDTVEMLKPLTGTTIALTGKIDPLEVECFSFNTDNTLANITFAYDNTTYMYYNRIEDRFDYNVHLSTGTNNVYCNQLFETSDKRLKENITDVDEDCSELVKKINVKTFNMKGDDKKKNHIGFIADELQELLPKKFEGVVDKNGNYLGVNYGKMTAILMKALQEEMNKRVRIESRLFELEDIVKEMRGKGKGEKPKPKSKAKAKNVD